MRTDKTYIRTYTGRQFWPLDPQPEDVCIEDIAHALSNLCRFAGHCRYFYSVGEHSVRVSKCVSREHELWALLHDASEAYLVDMPRPIKYGSTFGPEYRAAEGRLMAVICGAFGLPIEEPEEVRWADKTLLVTEQRDLMTHSSFGESHGCRQLPLAGSIEPMTAHKAEQEFLSTFRRIQSCQETLGLTKKTILTA